MRVVITLEGKVRKETISHICDLSSCGLPENFWALQWEEWEPNKGHIEFNSPMIPNQEITSLPAWVDCCLQKWQEAHDAELAAIAIEANNQPTTQGTQTL